MAHYVHDDDQPHRRDKAEDAKDLCFLLRNGPDDTAQVLLRRKLLGFGAGKIVGLGGHVDPGEDARTAAVRDTLEESALIVEPQEVSHRATVVFRFPAKPTWDRDVAVFTANRWRGQMEASERIAPEMARRRWAPV